MALLTDILSRDWQISLRGAGFIEQGLADVRQCLDIILRTKKGSDPLRPEFGSDIYKYVDKPIGEALPLVKVAILEAIEIWEPRVEIVRITHIVDVSHAQFFVTYRLVDDALEDQVQIYLNGGVIVTPAPQQGLILEAIIPSYTTTLLLEFIVNHHPVLPTPPVYGFSTAAQMFTWVQAYWGHYGNWYLQPDKLVLFMHPGMASTASLSIQASTLTRVVAPIPNMAIGGEYTVDLYVPEVGGVLTTGGHQTIAEMLQWVTDNWGEYGTWSVENAVPTAGDFNEDFNEDFFTEDNQYLLVLYTLVPGKTLNVSVL